MLLEIRAPFLSYMASHGSKKACLNEDMHQMAHHLVVRTWIRFLCRVMQAQMVQVGHILSSVWHERGYEQGSEDTGRKVLVSNSCVKLCSSRARASNPSCVARRRREPPRRIFTFTFACQSYYLYGNNIHGNIIRTIYDNIYIRRIRQ